MPPPVVYDITLLTSRIVKQTPNGVDRIDLSFARHFLDSGALGCIFTKRFGFRTIPGEVARDVLVNIEEHFGERDDPEEEPAFRALKRWLAGDAQRSSGELRRITNPPRPRAGRIARAMIRLGPAVMRSMRAGFPKDARYVNVSQHPLGLKGAFDGFAARRDIKAAFFVHDLLPLSMPEYFRPWVHERHLQRLRNVADFAAGAFVSTEVVRDELARYLSQAGQPDLPILRTPMPISAAFTRPERADRERLSAEGPYFVMCATIEPRKNHLMMLNIWRELARRRGGAAPRLILIGARGWENENIIDMLDRCRELRGRVVEVSGLSTPSIERVLRDATALLMPTFGEGYGIPLIEALMVGAPVIASDLPVFREIAGGAFTALDPLDTIGWLRTIEQRIDASTDPPRLPTWRDRVDSSEAFAAVDRFLERL